jgi:hypothetical protein
MAKMNPPNRSRVTLEYKVDWTTVEKTGLLPLLKLPREVQIQIVQHRYPWFEPVGMERRKESTYTKAWWDTLTGDQQTVRWALAFPSRCRRGYSTDEPTPTPKVDFYTPVSEQNALSWYAALPEHLVKPLAALIAKQPSTLEAKPKDELYQRVAQVWGQRPELPEEHADGMGIRGDDDMIIEVWREWAYLYTQLAAIEVIYKEAPRVQAERKMLSQALGLTQGGNGFPTQAEGLDDTQAATVRWIQSTGQSPLEFLVDTYRSDDPEVRTSDKLNAAKALLDFVHRKVPVRTEIETKDVSEPKLDAKVLKGLSAKELAVLETLLNKMNKV